jgi:hypothetical protein
LLLACCFPGADSRKTATKQQANKNLEGTWYGFNSSFYGQKDHEGSKKYFAEPLYTLCIFPFSLPDICAKGGV